MQDQEHYRTNFLLTHIIASCRTHFVFTCKINYVTGPSFSDMQNWVHYNPTFCWHTQQRILQNLLLCTIKHIIGPAKDLYQTIFLLYGNRYHHKLQSYDLISLILTAPNQWILGLNSNVQLSDSIQKADVVTESLAAGSIQIRTSKAILYRSPSLQTVQHYDILN